MIRATKALQARSLVESFQLSAKLVSGGLDDCQSLALGLVAILLAELS